MPLKRQKSFSSKICFLLLIFQGISLFGYQSVRADAPAPSFTLERKLDFLTGHVEAKSYQTAYASASTNADAPVAPCLQYLIAVAHYGKFAEINQSDIKDINKKFTKSLCEDFVQIPVADCLTRCEACSHSSCESNEPCTECRARQHERHLFYLLTNQSFCEKNLQAIEDVVHETRARQQTRIGAPLLAAGGLALAAATVLGLVSRYSLGCSSVGDLPTDSDGKKLECVYPLNYRAGVPALIAVGVGLTIGGAVELKKAHDSGRQIGHMDTTFIQAKCPPSATAVDGGEGSLFPGKQSVSSGVVR